MSNERSVKKFKATNIIFGLLTIILALMVFIFPGTTLTLIIYIIAFSVMLGGIIRLINAFSDEKLSNFKVLTRFIVGLTLLVLSIAAIFITLVNPTYSISVLILMLAIALLILGLGRLIIGLIAKGFETWFRAVFIVIGLATLIISIIIFLMPTIGAIYLLILLSVNLLMNGIGRFLLGVVGPEKKN